MNSPTVSAKATPAGPASNEPGRQPLDSIALFQGRQEIVIRHDGQDYRLRVTRQNKLILTK